MGEQHVILDFDGVVSARDPERMTEEWGLCHTLNLRGFRVTYAPRMTKIIERWSRDGVNITWLTTWGKHSAEEFKVLGLSPHHVIGVKEYEASTAFDTTWWKWKALDRFVSMLPKDARIVWCDDRMDMQSRTMPQIIEFRLRRNVLSFCPSISTGLTPSQVTRIGKFLT